MSKVFLIMGAAMAGRFLRELTIRQLRALAAVQKHRSVTAAAKQLHLTQPAVTLQLRNLQALAGPAADPAHQRRHAADRCRARGAGARRADRGRDRRLRDLAGDDGGQDRGPHLDRRRQHREIFRAVHDLRIFEAASEHRRHALDRKPAGDRHRAARLRSRLRDHGPPAGRHRHGRSPDRRSSPCHHRADRRIAWRENPASR